MSERTTLPMWKVLLLILVTVTDAFSTTLAKLNPSTQELNPIIAGTIPHGSLIEPTVYLILATLPTYVLFFLLYHSPSTHITGKHCIEAIIMMKAVASINNILIYTGLDFPGLPAITITMLPLLHIVHGIIRDTENW